MKIKDPQITRYTIQKLEIYTQYRVSLQVYNPEGLGPATTVVVMTDEGVPSMPVNVSLREVTNSTVRVLWRQPTHPNGIIQGYRLYFNYQNFTDVKTVREPKEKMSYLLAGLSPFTEYNIWLRAFTWKNEGQQSQRLPVQTDVSAPSRPIITNLTCKDEQSIYLQWDRPTSYFKQIDFYHIFYKNENQDEFKEVAVGTNATFAPNSVVGSKLLIEGLQTNLMHTVKIRAATRSIYDAAIVYNGTFSEDQKILLRRNCDLVQASFTRSSSTSAKSASSSTDDELDLGFGMIAGVACVGLSVVFALLALAMWRKYFNESYYYLDEAAPFALTPTSAAAAASQCDWDSVEPALTTAVPAHLYIQRVAAMHANGGIFAKEFLEVVAASNSINHHDKDGSSGKGGQAAVKNRVQLRPLPGQKRGDVVPSALFVDGFQKSRAYTSFESEKNSSSSSLWSSSTERDLFWRSVWEHRVRVVVLMNGSTCEVSACAPVYSIC